MKALICSLALALATTAQANEVVKSYTTAYKDGQISTACGLLTDAAKKNLVAMIAPKFPTSLPTSNASLDCTTFLTLAQKGLTQVHKTKIGEALPKVTFTVKSKTAAAKELVMDNLDPKPIAIQLKSVNSAWKIENGFQGVTQGSPDPALAPLPAGYACFVLGTCKLLDVTDPVTGGGGIDPVVHACEKLDLANCPLDKLCAGKPGIKNLNLTKLADDIDGDGLSNGLEVLLATKGKLALDVCNKDTDGDTIPDLYDLVNAKGKTKGKGIAVEVAITEIRQNAQADGVSMDDGPFNDQGDPWIADAVVTTGAVETSKGAKRIEIEGLTAKNHPTDPGEKLVKKFKMKGAPVLLSEDVRTYARNVPLRFAASGNKGVGESMSMPKIDPANLPKSLPTTIPMIGVSAVFLDDDDDCDNEVYAVNEPELEACEGKTGLVPKFSGLSLAMELFGAQGTVADIANSAAKTVGDPTCVNGYGITACFQITITNADGGKLDACSLALATTGWQSLAKKLPIVSELPTNVLEACNLPTK